MMKASAISHPNIAFVKYWGKKDKENSIPTRENISMTLDGLETRTTVEFSGKLKKDDVTLNGKKELGSGYLEIVRQLDKMRGYIGAKKKANVVSVNNFPTGAGIASSAAGFSALAIACNEALGLCLDSRELSRAAGFVSGSAARSIKGGYVVFHTGESREECFAEQVYDEKHWRLYDIITVVNPSKKKVSSRQGMDLSMQNCPFYEEFASRSRKNVSEVIRGLSEKNFKKVGETLELDSLMLHSVMMTTRPSLFYWSEATIEVMKEVMGWREEGIPAYHTVDAGPNVHIITTEEFADEVARRAKEINGVKDIIKCGAGGGPEKTEEHLF